MRFATLVLTGLVLTTAPAHAQAPVSPRSDHVGLQVLAGGLGAVAGSIGLAMLGASAIGPHDGEDPGLVGAIYGFGAGVLLGSSLGVHLTAKGQGMSVSFGSAFGGALLGFLALWPAGSVVDMDPDHGPFWLAVYGLPVVGAVLMTNLEARGSARRAAGVDTRVTPVLGAGRIGVNVSF